MCPAYSGPICSLCCTLEARCRDQCKTNSRFTSNWTASSAQLLPARVGGLLNTRAGHFGGLLLLSNLAIGLSCWRSSISSTATPTQAQREAIAQHAVAGYFLLSVRARALPPG